MGFQNLEQMNLRSTPSPRGEVSSGQLGSSSEGETNFPNLGSTDTKANLRTYKSTDYQKSNYVSLIGKTNQVTEENFPGGSLICFQELSCVKQEPVLQVPPALVPHGQEIDAPFKAGTWVNASGERREDEEGRLRVSRINPRPVLPKNVGGLKNHVSSRTSRLVHRNNKKRGFPVPRCNRTLPRGEWGHCTGEGVMQPHQEISGPIRPQSMLFAPLPFLNSLFHPMFDAFERSFDHHSLGI